MRAKQTMINLEKAPLTLEEKVAKLGAREVAYQLISNKVLNLCGITLADLPDTAYLADMIDGLEDILQADSIDRDAIIEVLNEVDSDFIETLVYY